MPTDSNNKWWIGLIVAVITAAAAYLGYQLVSTQPAPQPTPAASATATPSPTPTPSPTATSGLTLMSAGLEKPSPENQYSPALSASQILRLAVNETGGFIVQATGLGCYTVTAPSGLTLSPYEMRTVTTTQPSHSKAIVGKHYDPLMPVTQLCAGKWYWLDVTPDSTLAGKQLVGPLAGLALTVSVAAWTMPALPSVPLYVGMSSWALVLGHKMPSSIGVGVQGPLTQKYVDLFRAHRLEPDGQRVVDPAVKSDGTVDLDMWSTYGASYRQLVLTNALAPVNMASPTNIGTNWLTAAQLAAWDKTVVATPALAGSWAYVTDEPSDLAGTVTRLQLVRANAPHVKTMVTTEPTTQLLGLVDYFVNVFEYFKQPGHWTDYTKAPNYWLYGSCMSHGSCSNGTVGTLTGSPDLMLDEPTVFARAFPAVVYTLGAKAGLYYSSVAAYGSLDPWTSQYQFGGNGDGQLVYPCIKSAMPECPDEYGVPSIRMKMLRQGMNDVEWAKHLGRALPVTDQFTWSKNNSEYDLVRQ